MARGTKSEVRPGVWRLRVFVGTDPATGHPRQLSRTVRGGVRVAERELARFVTEAQAGDVPMGADQTLADFLDAWLAYVEPLRSPTTIRGPLCHKARRWKAALGSVRIPKLTAQRGASPRHRSDDLVGGRPRSQGTRARHGHGRPARRGDGGSPR